MRGTHNPCVMRALSLFIGRAGARVASVRLSLHDAGEVNDESMAPKNVLGLIAVAFGTAAFAQEAPTNPGASDEKPVEDVVITGSRLSRTGYETPTPVTVIGADDLAVVRPAEPGRLRE